MLTFVETLVFEECTEFSAFGPSVVTFVATLACEECNETPPLALALQHFDLRVCLNSWLQIMYTNILIEELNDTKIIVKG